MGRAGHGGSAGRGGPYLPPCSPQGGAPNLPPFTPPTCAARVEVAGHLIQEHSSVLLPSLSNSHTYTHRGGGEVRWARHHRPSAEHPTKASQPTNQPTNQQPNSQSNKQTTNNQTADSQKTANQQPNSQSTNQTTNNQTADSQKTANQPTNRPTTKQPINQPNS